MAFISPDILSPSSGSPVDGGVKSARAARPSSSEGGRKSFSAVLHSVRREEGKADTRETDNTRSSNKSQNKPQVDESRGRDRSVARTERSDTPSSKRTERDRSDDDTNKPVEASREDGAPSPVADGSRSDASNVGSQSVSAVTPLPNTTQTSDQEQVQTERNADSSGTEHQTTTVSFVSSPVLPEASTASEAALDVHAAMSPAADKAVQSKNQPEQVSTLPAIHSEGDAQTSPAVKHDSNMAVNGVDTKTVMADGGTHPASSGQQTGPSNPQSDDGPQRDLQLNSGQPPKGGEINRLVNDADQLAERITLVRPASSPSEVHATSRENKDHLESKAQVAVPLEDPAQSLSNSGNGVSNANVKAALLGGQQSGLDAMKHFSQLWADHNSTPHDHAEVDLPQAAVADRQVAGGQAAESMLAGAHGRVVVSPPPTPPPVPVVSQAPSVTPSHVPTDQSQHLMTRSVVLDLARPDLGHVNIRVAMMNDVVNTHLSADRPEVGQFLINGQDRLQAAFQANGLDMGQFRVDIDRQGAGRSFQQGPSQDQGHSWNQDSQGKWGQSQDRQDEPRSSLHGLLNLVA